MLTEKENKAIRNLENLSEFGLSTTLNQTDLDKMKLVLNLITKLQEENEVLEKTIDNSAEEQKEREKYTHSLEIKLQEKDRIINLMAERIEWLCKSNGILLDKEYSENFNNEDIKQYFKKLVKEE